MSAPAPAPACGFIHHRYCCCQVVTGLSADALPPTTTDIETLLKNRPAPAQPAPATFGNAIKNANYYLSQHALYALTVEERAGVRERYAILYPAWEKAFNAFEPMRTAKKHPAHLELKAAKAAATKEIADFCNLFGLPHKNHRRYLQYYHGAPASKYVDGKLRHYLIWRYYVWEMDSDDIYIHDVDKTPLGLLNPHAYFAARRAGEANFLDFLDKSQPAPELPSDAEDWPITFWSMDKFNNKTIEELAEPDPAGDEECAGCMHCDPAMAPAAPAEKLPLPPNSVIIVKSTFREHSSGSETYSVTLFSSYESASKYIINQFRTGGNALMNWSENNCFEDDDDEEPMEKPTVGWACRRFNPAALKEFISTNKYDNKLYGPYSDFCLHRPYEIFIKPCEVL